MWTDFEHRVWKKIKTHDIDQKKLILTISGGLDSMALLAVFSNLNIKNVQVLHFHHGDFENKDHRGRAFSAVQNFCADKNISFEFKKSEDILKSEAEFRAARNKFFNSHKTADSVFVTGHHLDDVLETRLIKMIRGSGAEGLKAFSEYNGEIFRPFLDVSKKEIFEYATAQDVKWIEDPTNADSDYLRNWIRNQWLFDLEAKQLGGVQNLAKSLDRLIHSKDIEIEWNDFFKINEKKCEVPRQKYMTLNSNDQARMWAILFQKMHIQNYTQGQINEILKRLNTEQHQFTFSILNLTWHVESNRIIIS